VAGVAAVALATLGILLLAGAAAALLVLVW
jgi:hypothetical protein